MNWPDRRLLELFDIDHPIVQAPMAGITSPAMAAAVSAGGGLGSLAAFTSSYHSLGVASYTKAGDTVLSVGALGFVYVRETR